MMRRNNSWNKPKPIKRCSCGAIMKKRTRVNYPFGRKSKSLRTEYFKCIKCGEKTN